MSITLEMSKGRRPDLRVWRGSRIGVRKKRGMWSDRLRAFLAAPEDSFRVAVVGSHFHLLLVHTSSTRGAIYAFVFQLADDRCGYALFGL